MCAHIYRSTMHMALLWRNGSGSLTFRGALSARKGVLRVSRVLLYNNISTTCRTCFVRRGQSGRVPFYPSGIRGRFLSSSSTLANKEQTDGGELLTVTPAPTFDSGVEASSIDAASASGLTDGLIAQTTENFAALGLGGHTPSGLLQTLLEFLHVNVHLPWWACIVTATVGVRLLLFPLAVRMMRDSAKIANLNPTASKIHETMAAYKRIGNQVAAAEEGAKLLEIYKRHGVNPVATMFMVPFFQLPVFMSFFWGIRGMAELPVQSMKTGGLYWFTDLTIPDPAYVLPLVACLAFISNVELGGEGGAPSSNETHRRLKMFMRASAVLILPVTVTFPAGMLVYWVTNSLYSTCQILFLKIPQVKHFFGIPKIVRPPADT